MAQRHPKAIALTCPRCEEQKPPSGFYWSGDGRYGNCKTCHNQTCRRWQLENPQSYAEAKRRYRATHKDRTARERWLRWRAKRNEGRDRLALQRSVGGSGA